MQPEEVDAALTAHKEAASPPPSPSPNLSSDQRREQYKVAVGKGGPERSTTTPLPGNESTPVSGPDSSANAADEPADGWWDDNGQWDEIWDGDDGWEWWNDQCAEPAKPEEPIAKSMNTPSLFPTNPMLIYIRAA